MEMGSQPVSGKAVQVEAFQSDGVQSSHFRVAMRYSGTAFGGEARAVVTITTQFSLYPVQLGDIWIQIGCTGAWYKLQTTSGWLRHATMGPPISGEHVISRENETSVTGAVKPIGGAAKSSVTSSVTFTSDVQPDVATTVNSENTEMTWNYDMRRVVPTNRDCLAENKEFLANALWAERGELVLTCAPLNRVMLDDQLKRLRPLSFTGMLAKLLLLGDLPSTDERTLSVHLTSAVAVS